MTRNRSSRPSSSGSPTSQSPLEVLEGLFDDLLHATASGLLRWQIDDAHPTSYCVGRGDWCAAIRSIDGDNQQPYALVLVRDAEAFEASSGASYALHFRDAFARLHLAAAASVALGEPLLVAVADDVRAMVAAAAAQPESTDRSEPAEAPTLPDGDGARPGAPAAGARPPRPGARSRRPSASAGFTLGVAAATSAGD